MNRKEFLQYLIGLAAAGLHPRLLGHQEPGDPKAPRNLPRRTLGAAGVEVTSLALGGFHVGAASSEKAGRAIIDAALDEGIRFFDTAESYQSGKSEEWLGAGLKSVRKKIFLMTKTHAPKDRSAESARRHLEGSLERLQTDYLDLWQLHSIKNEDDVEQSFRDGGAMEYITEMKSKGVVKHIGVTGHVSPAAQLRVLEHWDRGRKFDCMQFPINPIDFHQKSFQRTLLPELVKRKIGVLAMKTAAGGALLTKNICTAAECLRYVLSLPVSVAVVGMESPEEVRKNARQVRKLVAMTAEEREKLLRRIQPQASLSLEWYKK